MLICGGHKGLHKVHREFFPVRFVRSLWSLVFIFLFVPAFCFAGGDSTKTKNKKSGTEYPLDDPRNPNCPCHQYQKIADEEYKKLRQGNNSRNAVPDFSNGPKSSLSFAGFSSGRSKRKKNVFEKLLFRLNHKKFGKHRGWKKSSVKIADCFAWKR